MSALHLHRLTVAAQAGVAPEIVDRILGPLRERMWDWFHSNAEDELVSVSTLFGLIRVKVRVRHLAPFFERVFGPDPRNASTRASAP